MPHRFLAGLLALALSIPCLPASAARDAPPGATPATARLTVAADDGLPLALWARAPAHPRGTVLLVHGRTWSARPNFDLQVPGEPADSRSVLAALARAGYAAYAVDLRGYGATPRDASGWDTPARALADVDAVLDWIARRHPGLPPPALLGYSNGARLALLAAQRPGGKIEGGRHKDIPSVCVTRSPSRRVLTPAVTTRSPGATPARISTDSDA